MFKLDFFFMGELSFVKVGKGCSKPCLLIVKGKKIALSYMRSK